MAIGNASQYITFQADDTTGWSNEAITAGGWNGIHFMNYAGSGTDNSSLKYCRIKDTKYGYTTSVNYCNTLTTFRTLKVAYTDIFHNTAGTGLYVAGDNIIISTSLATDTVEFDHCNIYDNTTVFGILHNMNYTEGYTTIHDCEFHDNLKGSPIWGTWNNIFIDHNNIHDNTMINDSSPIKLSIGNGRISHNKIHHNSCDQLAAIGCRSGFIDIDDNLICNNQQLSGTCGATGGGGGIHLSYNEGATTFANTYYRVRNNVIANNYSAYGGGGLYIFNARAEISNNTFVNNTSATFIAKAILVLNPQSEAYIKNNLFYGNSTPNATDSLYTIGVYSANKIQVDYNYLPTGYSNAVYGIGGFQQFGDTAHNVIGLTPQLVLPTSNNNYTTDATASDFNISTTSPCVDKGDTTDTHPLAQDYAGHARVSGTKVDIGAYEVSKTAEWINDLQEACSYQLYPNPAISEVHVILQTVPATLQVLDMQGHLLYQESTTEKERQLSLQNYAEGIYLFRVMTVGQVHTSKLLIHSSHP